MKMADEKRKWTAYLDRLFTEGKEDTPEFVAVRARLSTIQVDVRTHLDVLLEAWEAVDLPEPGKTKKWMRVPVVERGKITGYRRLSATDGRQEAVVLFARQVRELRGALEAGADAKLVWLALSVGAGSVAIAHREAAHAKGAEGGTSKTGTSRATAEQREKFLASLRKAKGPNYNTRVKKAMWKSGWPLSLQQARRLGEREGLK